MVKNLPLESCGSTSNQNCARLRRIKGKDERLAKDLIPEDLIGIVLRRYKLEKDRLTLKEFWRSVAKLGGFLGRKNDGDPGWQTLWKGWVKLLTMQEAIEDFQKCG